ncbi:MAG: DUF4190 domain-containing protein [Marmoricola sp.]
MSEDQYRPPVYAVAPTSSKATTSLVLGIVSLVFCGLLLGIPAMIVAHQAKREIRESNGRLSGEGLATAGFVTGLIGTLWSVLAAVLVVGVFVFGSVFQDKFETHCTSTGGADGGSVTCD